ncbi:MAG: peptidylprolyl isomerase [Planctomycetota bacterium]|nr:MAG: peptidylprolyl isomerase [Planctomycetota bacterium]
MTATSDPALAALETHLASNPVDTAKDGWRTRLSGPPELPFTDDTTYHWVLSTNKGTLTVLLRSDVAPRHVASTLYLTRLGFYDGLAFHRVIQGFMAQGGCPLGRGTGGPGYTMSGEFDPSVKHDRPGLLSMANAGPGTDGSQFFLTFVPTPHLDGLHTIFGEVLGGETTLAALEAAGSPSGTPSESLRIESAVVELA